MRGMEAVIAIILLLLMTVAAAGALYFWMSSSQQTVSSTAATGMEKQTEQSSYRLIIESMWSSSTKICLSVRNKGQNSFSQSDMNNTGLFVNNTLVDWDKSTSVALEVDDYLTMCICNGTITTGCPASSLIFQYARASESSEYPTVPITVSPVRGSGDTQNYKYKTR